MRKTGFSLAVIYSSLIFSSLIAFLFTALIAQRLGEATFGKFSTVQIFVISLVVFTEIGLMQVATRKIAQNKDDSATIASNLLVIKFGLGLLGIVVALALAFLLGYPADTRLLIAIFAISLLPLSISNACVAIFYGNERATYSAIVGIGSSIGYIFGIIAVFLGGDLILVFLLITLSSLLTSVTCLVLLKTRFNINRFWSFDWPIWRGLAVAALPFGLMAIINRVGISFGPIMLSRTSGEIDVGYFNSAFKVIRIFVLWISAYNLVIYPVLSRLQATSQLKLIQSYKFSMKLMILLGLPVAVVLTVLSKQIILFAYQGYLPAVQALQILGWFLLFSLMATPVLIMLYAEGKQRDAAIIHSISVIISIIISLTLIPSFGLLGVCFALVAMELTKYGISYWRISKIHPHGLSWRTVLRVSFLCVAIAFIAIVFQNLHLVPLLILIGMFYLSLTIVLQIFSIEEWELILKLPLISKLKHKKMMQLIGFD